MKIYELEHLMFALGDLELSEVIKILKNGCEFICPKCEAKGSIQVCVKDACEGYYPAIYETHDCNICNGLGYTKKKVTPIIKTEVIGYE